MSGSRWRRPRSISTSAFSRPPLFRTLPCPTYPEIRLALASPAAIARHVERVRPDFIHIATEGPIGYMTRRYCRKRRWPFTTSYHTRFPEYVSARLPMPEDWFYGLQRRFHNGSAGTFVATPSLEADLKARGFERLMLWSRGVDTELFRPRNVRLFGDGPVFLYVGRIAVEKNIKAFLDLDLPGRKVLVGGGPQADELKRRYPEALFTGPREGEALAEAYASADVFVFPSLTDTFGLVLLEALASGVPVAAYPAPGPARRDHRPAGRRAQMPICRRRRSGRSTSTAMRHARMRSAIAGRTRRGSSSRTCWRPIIWACRPSGPGSGPLRGKRIGGKRKRPGWGGTGPSHSHASVWGTLWGNSRPPKDGYRPEGFKGGPPNPLEAFYKPLILARKKPASRTTRPA